MAAIGYGVMTRPKARKFVHNTNPLAVDDTRVEVNC